MALLLYFSKLERFTDEQRNGSVKMLKGSLMQERSFHSSRTLHHLSDFLRIYSSRHIWYTRSENQRQVYVKYSFDMGTRSKQKTERKRLEEVVSGVYVMEFVVFHGERLVYSIEDDPNGNAKIVESEVLKKKTTSSKNSSRFEQINSMLVKQEMRDDRSLLEDLDVYINTVHLFEENLKIFIINKGRK